MVGSDRGHGRSNVVVVVAREAKRVAVVVTAGKEGESAGGLLGIVIVRKGVLLCGRWRMEA